MSIKENLSLQKFMDPEEVMEWIQSLDAVVQRNGKEGAKEILEAIE